MNKIALFSAAPIAFAVSISVYAAKPVKITPEDSGETSGLIFRNYTVECSNGKRKPLTSWDSGKKWCVGKNSQDGCVKKQIKAAKTACKLD